MTKHAWFSVEVTDKDRSKFANLSGDFNPLYIDDDYIGVNFDMLDGRMNATISKAVNIAAKDRSPIGKLPTMDEAALDLKWVFDNAGSLIFGAVINFSGGNIP